MAKTAGLRNVGNLDIKRGDGVVELHVRHAVRELRTDLRFPATMVLLGCPDEVNKLIAILEEMKALPNEATTKSAGRLAAEAEERAKVADAALERATAHRRKKPAPAPAPTDEDDYSDIA